MALADLPARPCTSFEDIYNRYAKLVRKKLVRHDIPPESAAGLHQDIFLTLNDQIQKNGLPARPAAMLSTITEHAICNYLRRRARRPQRDAAAEPDEIATSSRSDIERRVGDAERKQLVRILVDKLKGEDAALIALIDLKGMTHEKVAWLFDRPVATVRTQHRRAREKLRARAEHLYKKEELTPVRAPDEARYFCPGRRAGP
jgi:RNA polymerase sigma factor (sigma-70 family)